MLILLQTIYIPDKDYEFGGSSESGGSVPVSPVALTPPAIVSSTISHRFDVKVSLFFLFNSEKFKTTHKSKQFVDD